MFVPLTRSRPPRWFVVGVIAAAVAAVAVVLVGGGPGWVGAQVDLRLGQLVEYGPAIVVLALGWPVALLIAARPQRGVLLLAALVPLDGLLLILPVPSWMAGWKEALLLYTLLWTFLTVIGKPRPPARVPSFVQPLLLYFAVGVVSASVVRGTQALVGLKIGYLFVLVILILWFCPFDAKDRDRLVSILMGMGFLTAVVGLAQQVLGAERLHAMGYEYDTTIRFTGGFVRSFSTFNLQFQFAFFLAMVLLVGIPVSLRDPARPRSILFFATSPVLVAALIFTFARGGWLALGLGLAYLGFTRYKVLLLGVPIAALSLAFLPGQFTAPAFQARSFNERQVGWVENIGKVTSRPVGNGIGTTGSAAEKTREVLRLDTNYFQPDNQYFKVLYELGVIGLWAFLFLLVSTFLYARHAGRVLSGFDQALADGVTANILGVIAACTVATYFEMFPMDFYYWLLMGVLVVSVRESS